MISYTRILLAAGAMLASTAALPASAQSNPTEAQNQAARATKPNCDPWITIAYKRLYGAGYVPADWMCSTMLYRGGRWGPFSELMDAVRAKDYGLNRYAAVKIGGTGPLAGKFAIGVFSGSSLVAAGGGNILAALVAAGGGNLVAAGGGNLVAAGGGNLVAAGGGNLINLDAGQLLSPGPRTLMSASSRSVPVKD